MPRLQVPYPNLGGLPGGGSQSPTIGAESDLVGDRPRGERLDLSARRQVADFDRPVQVGHSDPPAVWAEVPGAVRFLGLLSQNRRSTVRVPDSELGGDGILSRWMEPGGQELAIGAELEHPGGSSGVREPEQIAIVGYAANVDVSFRVAHGVPLECGVEREGADHGKAHLPLSHQPDVDRCHGGNGLVAQLERRANPGGLGQGVQTVEAPAGQVCAPARSRLCHVGCPELFAEPECGQGRSDRDEHQ